MASISIERLVSAPPQRVFEAFTDLRRAPDFIRGIKRLEVLTPGPIGKGTRFLEARTMFGREATAEMELAEFTPGKSYVMACEASGARYRTRFDFAPDATGTTVVVRFEVTPVSFFAKLMRPLLGVMMKSCAKAFAQDLDDMQARAEGGRKASPGDPHGLIARVTPADINLP